MVLGNVETPGGERKAVNATSVTRRLLAGALATGLVGLTLQGEGFKAAAETETEKVQDAAKHRNRRRHRRHKRHQRKQAAKPSFPGVRLNVVNNGEAIPVQFWHRRSVITSWVSGETRTLQTGEIATFRTDDLRGALITSSGIFVEEISPPNALAQATIAVNASITTFGHTGQNVVFEQTLSPHQQVSGPGVSVEYVDRNLTYSTLRIILS